MKIDQNRNGEFWVICWIIKDDMNNFSNLTQNNITTLTYIKTYATI